METFQAQSRGEWREWLEKYSQEKKEIKLIYFKKNIGKPSVDYEGSVEEALCFGWIDGVRHSVDEESYSVRFTPRKPKSIWSLVNKERVEKLIKEGKMKPEGLEMVEIAKINGQWDEAYSMRSKNELPEDLKEALIKNLDALEFFETLSPSNQFICIYRIKKLKSPILREQRAKEFIQLLAKKIKPSEW